MSVTERRSGDRRTVARTTMPEPWVHDTNPEVMGRTEPQEVEKPRSEMWPDMSDFQLRFEQIQAEFIDDPKAAVQKAERLTEEATDQLTKSMRERMQAMRKDTGDNADTEQMRVTMRTYREFIQSLPGAT